MDDGSQAYLNNSAIRTFSVFEFLAKSGFPLTLSAITEGTGLDKATTRRFLTTLCNLGYVDRTTDGKYKMTSRVLDLSSTYLRSVSLPEKSVPYLEEFCRKTMTSTSMAILDGVDVVYVAHVSVREALSVGVQIGTRLPAHATAVGKVLLSHRPTQEVIERYGSDELTTYTSRTIDRVSLLVGALSEIKRQGWAISEEEYELGVRAAACPIVSSDGAVISAINVSTRTADVDRIDFLTQVVPELIRTADLIAKALGGVAEPI
ncbi:helix-turn-helix domain-containing protein [Alicyclobacillus cycloheptanicus]|uniref:IclR family pca regulon transcriptional regulator n=1 Tax=Alicyclobacillus cycloheptanicus TaxID=1457 RepID=A0ABT9XIR6_9BACL|nr:IclR family transcriptional regulator C-terminal domain-containing protein [Alicyclobacillus cycloheptanicus]MDQ0189919.1 IclR family pca regulon transcriptional regulator [Alicyclobacillus cycloheptanicus]WDM02178.1 helix-turn-helix domain-containing protein [Alicyclobacillus cycloheptanicus]